MGRRRKEATLTFTAEPGKLAHFGPVEISGNKSVGDNIIRRELTFKPGDLYRRSVVQDTQRRLYGMELFQFVNVEPLNPEQQPAEVPIRVTVAEGKHQRVNFGVGYGTEEKARVDAEYHHVNFLGGARSAGAHARWSSLDRGVRLDFNQPYFFAPALLARRRRAAVVHLHAGVPLDRHRRQGDADAPRRASERRGRCRSRASTTAARSRTTRSTIPTLRDDLIALGLDPTTGEQDGTLNALGFDFQHSTADNLLNAHRGYQLAFHAEQAGRFVPGTFNYYAASADGRHYLPLGDRVRRRQPRCRSATSGRSATIRPTCRSRRSTSSAARRASAAGAATRSARSADRACRSAATACSRSARSCARSCAATSAACCSSTPATSGRTRGASICNDLRYAVGPGLRYQTPVGPIRFDVGYQLNPIPGLLVNGEPQTRPLADALQHRSGVLMWPGTGVRSRRTMRIAQRLASRARHRADARRRRGGGGDHRVADRLVQELAARLHRARRRTST